MYVSIYEGIHSQIFLFVLSIERGEKIQIPWGHGWGSREAATQCCAVAPRCQAVLTVFGLAGRVPSPALLQAAGSGLRGAAAGQGQPDCGSLPAQ